MTTQNTRCIKTLLFLFILSLPFSCYCQTATPTSPCGGGSVVVFDDFNRDDSPTDLGNASGTGQTWIQANQFGTPVASFGIGFNQAYDSVNHVAAYRLAIINSFLSDCTITCVVSNPDNYSGLCFRCDPTNPWGVGDTIRVVDGPMDFVQNGIPIAVSLAYTPPQMGTWKVVCAADHIDFSIDGTPVMSVISTVNETNTYHGLSSYPGLGAISWDDYTLTGGAGSTCTDTPTSAASETSTYTATNTTTPTATSTSTKTSTSTSTATETETFTSTNTFTPVAIIIASGIVIDKNGVKSTVYNANGYGVYSDKDVLISGTSGKYMNILSTNISAMPGYQIWIETTSGKFIQGLFMPNLKKTIYSSKTMAQTGLGEGVRIRILSNESTVNKATASWDIKYY